MKKTLLLLVAIIGIASCSNNSDTTGQNLNGNPNDTTGNSNLREWSVRGHFMAWTHTNYSGSTNGSQHGYYISGDRLHLMPPDFFTTTTTPRIRLVKSGSYTADSIIAADTARYYINRYQKPYNSYIDSVRYVVIDTVWCFGY